MAEQQSTATLLTMKSDRQSIGSITENPASSTALQLASALSSAASLVLKIHGLGGRRWRRNVAKGARIGPWLQAKYEVLNRSAWAERGACLYLVSGCDGGLRYVGISRNGLKHRWRMSPALDAETMQLLPAKQLFHSQCWKHIEAETVAQPGAWFEVRAISGVAIQPILKKLGPPLSAFTALGNDGEGVAAAVERWICNNSSRQLACWNSAMAGGSKV